MANDARIITDEHAAGDWIHPSLVDAFLRLQHELNGGGEPSIIF